VTVRTQRSKVDPFVRPAVPDPTNVVDVFGRRPTTSGETQSTERFFSKDDESDLLPA